MIHRRGSCTLQILSMVWMIENYKISGEFVLQVDVGNDSDGVPAFLLLARDKADKDKENYKKLIEAIQESGKVGTFGCHLWVSVFVSITFLHV